MYNFRDKAELVIKLKREKYAEIDLKILRKISPDHIEANSSRPANTRHESILHALLDKVTIESIEHLRSEMEHSDEGPANEGPANEGPANEGPANEGPANEGPANEGPANEGPANEGPANEGPEKKSGKKSKKRTNTH